MKFKKGEEVICRNVKGIIVSYDNNLEYYKVREITTKSLMSFVNEKEIKSIALEEKTHKKNPMNSLEKALIALRGAFQYADKHNIHVDNKHSIILINKALNENRKESSK